MVEIQKTRMVGTIRLTRRRRNFACALASMLALVSCAGCSSTDPPVSIGLAKVSPAARMLDYAATSKYLRARAEAVRVTMAKLPLDRSSSESVLEYVRSECPGALRGTPAVGEGVQSAQERLITAGIVRGIEGSIIGPWAEAFQAPLNTTAARQFETKVASLHWADRRITELVNAFVGAEAQLSRQTSKDVCGAIRHWVASGYRMDPVPELRPRGAIGQAWMSALRAVGCRLYNPPIERTLFAVLMPYERPGGETVMRQIETTETRLWASFEKAKQGEVDMLFRVLGLTVPSHQHRKSIKDLKPPRPLVLVCGRR